MLRLLFLTSFILFSSSSLASATNPKIQEKINTVFSDLEHEAFSKNSLQRAQSKLQSAKHPSTLTANILLAQYEIKSKTLVKGLLAQLGEEAKEHPRNTEEFSSKDIDEVVNLYDGSSASLAETLFWLRGQESSKHIDWGTSSPYFTIPCNYFYRHSDIGQFTKFGGRHRHRHSRPILDISCHNNADFKETYPNIFALWTLGRDVAFQSPSCGTIYKDHAASRRFSLYKLFYRPSEFRKKTLNFNQKNRSLENLRNTALFDWALVGRQNYETFLELETLYDAAKLELAAYFEKNFDYPEGTLSPLIPHMLLSQIHGGARQPSFSRALDSSLTGQRDIRATLLSGELPSEEELLMHKDNIAAEIKPHMISHAGFPEPLLHISVKNSPSLQKMIALGYDIEAKGALGKTALMVAAQDDNYIAAQTLIEAGANVNAKSAHPNDIPHNGKGGSRCFAYNVKTGERTALNYAVSEASEAVVNLLLENGAKTNTLDSSGYSIGDYLDGTGPTAKNSKISAKFRDMILK